MSPPHYGRRLICRKTHGKGFAVGRTWQRAHGKRPSAKTAFAVCNISSTRQSLCHVPNLTHGKLLGTTATMMWQSPLPCASPVWHTAKNGNFAVCCGHYTQQRARILNIFFCGLRIWYPKQYKHFIYIYHNYHRMQFQISIASISYYLKMHRCKQTLVSFIDNHK